MKSKKKAVIDSFHSGPVPSFVFDEVESEGRNTNFYLDGVLVASFHSHMLYAWHSEAAE
jgi:hypothetical protein